MPKLRNCSKGDSNPGSLDCESDILPLSYRASLANMRGGRGLVVRVFGSGLLGRGFDPQPGRTNIDGKVPAMD